ncbi:hypothetical protein R5R35_013756 [Gryllus longicercus]|uniref:PHD-type domain-containing protein n=1 Tax=Gryllus longicercus TaxID=2509291 RepID=A0AAN9VXG8_9ORTH
MDSSMPRGRNHMYFQGPGGDAQHMQRGPCFHDERSEKHLANSCSLPLGGMGPEFKPPVAGVPDPPIQAKKKRRTSSAASTPSQPAPALQDLLPPPLTGYGDTIVASNPFDDSPPQMAHSMSMGHGHHMHMNHHHHHMGGMSPMGSMTGSTINNSHLSNMGGPPMNNMGNHGMGGPSMNPGPMSGPPMNSGPPLGSPMNSCPPLGSPMNTGPMGGPMGSPMSGMGGPMMNSGSMGSPMNSSMNSMGGPPMPSGHLNNGPIGGGPMNSSQMSGPLSGPPMNTLGNPMGAPPVNSSPMGGPPMNSSPMGNPPINNGPMGGPSLNSLCGPMGGPPLTGGHMSGGMNMGAMSPMNHHSPHPHPMGNMGSMGGMSGMHPMGMHGPPHGFPGPGMGPKPMPVSAGKVYPPDQPMVFNPQNPNAPPIYPCGTCHKEVHDNDQAILCESGCNFWFHRICTGLTEAAYQLLTAEVYAEWVCDKCLSSKNIPLVKFKP